MKTKRKHPFLNKLFYMLAKENYREIYKVMISQGEYEAKGLPKYSLFDAIMDHLYGRKYYTVLLSRPNIKVKGSNGKHTYETSSDIFFSEREAWEYYEKMHDTSKAATFNSHQIISFRSKEKIPVWNQHRDPNCTQLY